MNLQKHEIIKNIILLGEKVQYVLFILNRSANTYQKFFESDKSKIDEFNSVLKRTEIPMMGNILNEDIPLLKNKIKTSVLLDFFNKEEIKELHDDYEKELKKWHDFAINEPLINTDFFRKKTSEISGLKTEELEAIQKKLIEAIKEL